MKADKIAPVKPRCLKTADASRYVGLSARGLLDMTRAHKIPHIRLGTRTIVYELSDLDAFIEARKVGAAQMNRLTAEERLRHLKQKPGYMRAQDRTHGPIMKEVRQLQAEITTGQTSGRTYSDD